MIRYAITDRSAMAGGEAERRAALVRQATRLAIAGVDYLQVREKDLSEGEAIALVLLLRAAVQAVGGRTVLLLNADVFGRSDDGNILREKTGGWPETVGVHLPGVPQVREGMDGVKPGMKRDGAWGGRRWHRPVSVSCHSVEEAERARGVADVLLFAPVFEKRAGGAVVKEGVGLEMLQVVCRAMTPLPVLALGGVTEETTGACLRAGAAGVAGIRMFQDWRDAGCEE